MVIKERLITVNAFSRPGTVRPETLGVVVHWTGAPGQENDATHRYFETLARQDSGDRSAARYASAHAIVGMDGEIIQVLPWSEVAFHVGAQEYTAMAKERFGRYATSRSSPNHCLIGIEMCHPDTTGIFTPATLDSAARLTWYLLVEHHLKADAVYRHYDVTGKVCPKYMVDFPESWWAFRRKIGDMGGLA